MTMTIEINMKTVDENGWGHRNVDGRSYKYDINRNNKNESLSTG